MKTESNKNRKTLIIENTYYSILLYILSDVQWRNKDYYIIRDRVSQDFINRLSNYVNSVTTTDFFPRIRISQPIKSYFQRLKFIKLIKDYNVIFGNIYELKVELYKGKTWIQIDDGEFTYAQLKDQYRANIPFKKFRNSFLFKNKLDVEYDFDFKSVNYLLPNSEKYLNLADKYSARFVDISSSFKLISVEDRKDILSLFGLNHDLKSDGNLILMQPLYSDGLVKSEREEIDLYKRMLSTLGIREEECVFKPHPASQISYNEYFPVSFILPKDFPSELLTLSGVEFNKVATLFSGGIRSFEHVSKQVYFFGGLGLSLKVNVIPYKIIDGVKSNFNPEAECLI
ncbi:glycosyltransferase family 52 [uncultured Pantoea sp.]|uniref:glycosyltransferase family 52 n=1 Tax=uncultured Pantoea sp. TaxID=218084 RepID=UPI0025E3716B|nr:glycosyltransferase family 52 [uncultured Pantoea sp.]